MKRYKIFAYGLFLSLFSPKIIFAAEFSHVTLLGFLAHPYVASIFVILGIVSLIVEFVTPGFGLGALMSLVFFSLFFFASIATGIGSLFMVFLFIVGILLLLLEAFVPGFGLPGIGGIIAMALSIGFALGSLEHAIITLSIAFLLSFSLSYYLIQKGLHSAWIEKIVHKNNIFLPNGMEPLAFHVNIGDIGISSSNLRPSGNCLFDNREYSVVAEEGSFIPKETFVEVTAISGRTIYVKEKKYE